MTSFFSELKRRNVYKVAVAYAVVGWLLVQIATQTFPFFEIPNWAIRLVILIVIIGFPIALVLGWAFELTPEGVKRTESATDSPSKERHGRTWIYIVIAGGLLSVALFFLGRYSAPRSAREPVSSGKSIAVLPFENRSRDPENAYFADGIQDEILTRLAKIADLKVISRTSTQRYKSSPGNVAEIAKQLGVEHVLEGSVQKAGEQVRVTVQLIRGATDSHVWAETYDRKLTDIFAVESEIAETIAKSLRAKLTPREQQAVAAKPTDNPAAYEAYLRGLALWNRAVGLPADFDEMVTHFSRAVELDPKFAIGWSYLSVVLSYKYHEFEPTPQRAAQAKEALEQAQRLQPELGEAHFAEGMYAYKVLRDFEKALDAFKKARQSAANRPLAVEFSAYVKRRQGKWDEALRLHEESLELDPRNPIILSEAALSYRALRRFDEAVRLIDRAREIEPENARLLAFKAEIALVQGDSETAGRYLKEVKVDGRDPILVSICARYLLLTRQFPEAIGVLKRVLAENNELPPAIVPNYGAELAIAEALAGNPDAKGDLERSRGELAAIRAQGGDLDSNATKLLLVCGFLKDKATIDNLAEQLRHKIESDAMEGPLFEEKIAIARAHIGETEVALQIVKKLLSTPYEGSLTPALLRMDPLWDPLRQDPRFRELAEAKP